MSRKMQPVSMVEFNELFEHAQYEHRQNDEPIPSLNTDSIAKISGCLNAPFQTFGGRQLLPGFYPKAAALFYYIAKGHPLGNGNKRMACLVTFYFCYKNGRFISFTDREFIQLSKYAASSKPEDEDQVRSHIESTLRRRVRTRKFLAALLGRIRTQTSIGGQQASKS